MDATGEEEPRDEVCSHCLQAVAADLGVENSLGEVLCGSCYFALWGPRAKTRLRTLSEALRPQPRRPQSARPIWIPGPAGELDPEAKLRRGGEPLH